MIVLRRNDARILVELQKKGPLSPTDVGSELGYKYEEASAKVNKGIKRLLALNLIAKDGKNKRVVKYRCIKKIPPLVIAKDSEFVAIPVDQITDLVPNPFLPKALQPVTDGGRKIKGLLAKLENISTPGK